MPEDQDQLPTEQPVHGARSGVSTQVAVARFVYYVAGVIAAFLIARIVLLLLAANQGSAFVDFVYTVGGWFASPFYGIFSYQPQYGQSVLEISSIVAVVVYSLVAMAIVKLIMLTDARGDRAV